MDKATHHSIRPRFRIRTYQSEHMNSLLTGLLISFQSFIRSLQGKSSLGPACAGRRLEGEAEAGPL